MELIKANNYFNKKNLKEKILNHPAFDEQNTVENAKDFFNDSLDNLSGAIARTDNVVGLQCCFDWISG